MALNVANLFSMAGRVALVTGGGTGLGLWIARGLVSAGCKHVYIVGRREDRLRAAATSHIIPLVGDVATREGCVKIADAFTAKEREVGVADEGVVLDALVNNAGVMSKHEGQWEPWDYQTASAEGVKKVMLQCEDDVWAQELAINTSALQWMSAAVLPYLARAAKTEGGTRDGRGSIVNITSIIAWTVTVRNKVHLYGVSKVAAEGLTTRLSTKLAHLGVRVNSIAPGAFPSDMSEPENPNSMISRTRDIQPLGRVGEEEDIVGGVLYLCSRAGSYVVGATIKMDGGVNHVW